MTKLLVAALLFISTVSYAASPEVEVLESAVLSAPLQLVYPPKAEREEVEGTVVLQMRVLADGSPVEVAVFKSSGSSLLDAAAAKSAAEAMFFPAKNRSGKPVDSTVFLPVRFELLP